MAADFRGAVAVVLIDREHLGAVPETRVLMIKYISAPERRLSLVPVPESEERAWLCN